MQYEFGPFRLIPPERLLLRDGQPVALPPKAYDLMVVLVSRAGRLTTKEQLLAEVWPGTFVEEANLSYTVSLLRKALGDDVEPYRYIETIAKRGYRFKAAVATPAVSSVDRSEPVRWTRRRIVLVVASAVALAILAAVSLRTFTRPNPSPPPVARLSLIPPEGVAVENAQISPDGRRIAFIGRDAEAPNLEPATRRLWIQALDSAVAVPVPGGEGALSVFWAPDSEQLAFEAPTLELKKVSVHGGAPQTLCQAWNVAGTWNRAGGILFQSGGLPDAGVPASSGVRKPAADQGLLFVSEGGGQPVTVTRLNASKRELQHLWPQFLPDGRHFLYVVHSAEEKWSGLYAGSLDSPDVKRVLDVETAATYIAPGYLLFARDGAIVAQRFDLARLELTGEAVPIASDSAYQAQFGTPQFSTSPRVVPGFPTWFTMPLLGSAVFSSSASGVVVYSLNEPYQFQFTWVNRDGAPLGDIGSPGPFRTFDLSSDGKRLIVARPAIDRANLWVVDLDRNSPSQLTFGRSFEFDPRWGPDRQSVVVTTRTETGRADIVEIRLDGRRAVRLENAWVDSWSRDGRFLLFRLGRELRALPLDGKRPPILIRQAQQGRFDQSQLSPDGRWIAYGSSESGYEVYVEPFPPTGERWQISDGGGAQPVWRRDSRELYYLGRDGTLFAVAFQAGSASPIGTTVRLFRPPVGQVTWDTEQYATNDGQRFLIMKRVERRQRPITVIINWQAAIDASRAH
jgi:DNA-binding winged helix-turn-helix (wHTH) protein/dipeptidyl aminopeptidase/acylaminoacyl peptidase